MHILRITTLAISLVAAAAVTESFAQATMTAQEQRNLTLVKDWWREILVAGHVEFAEKYMAEDYIQHNPGISTGRAAAVQMFGRRGAREIPPELDPKPMIEFAKGSYVALVWEREGNDQAGNAYKYNFFDVFRIENGKLAEHWDGGFRRAPDPNQPAPAAIVQGVGPKPVPPALSRDEQATERIATIAMKDILQYGHLELADTVLAPGYVQHNPNVPGTRAGFIEFFKTRLKPEPVKTEWKNEPDLILTSGNLTLYVMKRFAQDPSDPMKVYKWSWFDLFRVERGMVQEHWDGATKPGSQPPAPAQVPMPAGFKEYR